MTDRERYKQAFSALHASDDISLEVADMKKSNRKFSMKPVLAACLCVCILLSCAGAAYAADIGGIQETLRGWFGGKQVDVTVVGPSAEGDGGYEFTVDVDGELKTFSGGGVAYEADGSERPLTPEEVLADFTTQVKTDENGRVWLYHYDQSYDITDFLADSICKLALERDGETVYFDFENDHGTVNSYSMSSDATGSPADYTILK